MKFKEFIKICNEKEVSRKLLLYIGFSWLLIQVIATIWEPMGLSKNVVTYSIIILLLGLPTYIFYVWKTYLKNIYASEVKGRGIGKKGKISRNQFSFQTYYFVSLGIISFIVGSLVVYVYGNKFKENIVVDEIELEDKIAVLKFGNKTGENALEDVGDMAADWIVHGISQHQVAQVITPNTFKEYENLYKASVLPVNKSLRNYFKPKQIITGNYFLNNDRLIFQGSILDGKKNTVEFSFEAVECDAKNPLECIEILKQKILGYLVTEENEELNLQETPPNYKAYSKVIEAKANVAEHDKYINLLNEAIEIDPEYFEPKYLRVIFYYDRQQYAKADSLFQYIRPTSLTNLRQKNIIKMLKALLEGDNKSIYRYQKKEYNYARFDLNRNLSNLVYSLEFVNLPQEVESIYAEINYENLDIENCKYCQYRSYIQAMAYLELGEYEKIITLLQNMVDFDDTLTLKKAYLAAKIKLDELLPVKNTVTDYELVMEKEKWLDLCLFLGKTLLIEDKVTEAQYYFNLIIKKADSSIHEPLIASAFYFLEDYPKSVLIYTDLVERFPDDINYMTKLAISQHKVGEESMAQKSLSNLELLRKEYQFGALDYSYGQYYAIVGDNDRAIEYLEKSVAAGYWYTNNTFQNDPHFKDIRNEDDFEEILSFWH